MAPISSSRPARQTPAEVITPGQRDGWFALLFAHSMVTDRIDRVLQERHRIAAPGLSEEVFREPGALPHVRDAFIHPQIQGSDHCPIGVEIDDALIG